MTSCDCCGKEEGEDGKSESATSDFQLFQWIALEGRGNDGQTAESFV